MLNTNSPIPLYHQLAEILTEKIRSGEYKPGDPIPSEPRMVELYSIGRPTVRQAVELLVQKKMVERKRGSGTYVRHPEQQVDLFSLAGTSQAFSTRGIKTDRRMVKPLELKETDPDPVNPFSGREAYFLSRKTDVAGETVLLEEIWLHPLLFKGLGRFDLESQPLSQIVQDHFFVRPVSGRQVFRIAQLNKEQAGIFDVDVRTPVLQVERYLDFPDEKEAVFSKLYCRTDRFAFSQTIGDTDD